MATSGILVKNGAVSLVNGVYNKYSDDNNGRRWLSSDNLCLMHFTKTTMKKKVDFPGTSYVTPEMIAGDHRYYKFDKRNGEYYPINLVASQEQTLDEQLGNREKILVADSLNDLPRPLTINEKALGRSGERIYWLCDIAQFGDKADDFYVYDAILDSVKTLDTRTKEIENVSGTVTVDIEFLNLSLDTDADIVTSTNSESETTINPVNGHAQISLQYGQELKVYVKPVNQSSKIELTASVVNVVDRVAYFQIDALQDEPVLLNKNTYDQETYTAALYYTEPAFTLCEEIDMNHWSITEVRLEETGLTFKNDLYYAFTETSDTSPYDGLPWILIDGNESSLDSNLKVEYWDESSVQANTVTTTDPDGAIRTTTTFVNIITGETYTDTQVVREKHITEIHDVKRYEYVNLAVGKVYRFRFTSEFAQLGWIPGNTTQPIDAGIYKVDKIMSYYDSVIGRIDLFVNLYEPCGVSKSVFNNDKKRLAETTIYRLVSPNDPSKIYFVPNIFIEGQPDASVLKYNKLLLMIDLGVQPNSETVKALLENNKNPSHPAVKAMNDLDGTNDQSGLAWLIKQILRKEYGLVPTSTNSLIRFSVYGNTYLTDDGFESIVLNRETEKALAESEIDYNTIFNCADSNKWYKENKELKARVEHLNALIREILARRTGN